MYRIIYFTSRRGEVYVREFLLALPEKVAAKLIERIGYLEAHGPKARFPYASPLKDKIYELRGTFGHYEPRILYFFQGNAAVLTHGFLKKTRAVPQEEIDRAKTIRAEHLG